MRDNLQELYQEVILDHNKRPRNFGKPPRANHEAEGNNPLCGDHYKIYVELDGDCIRDAGFDGTGCAISKASASLLTEAVKGKSCGEVKELFDKIHAVVTTGRAAGGLGKLAVLSGVHKYPARVKCAILAWHALAAAMEGSGAVVTTEDEK